MALTEKRSERRRDKVEVLERPRYDWIWKPLLVLVVVYLLVVIGLGIWWSRTPEPLVIDEAVVVQRGTGEAARGAVTTAGLVSVVDTLLNKPGGYLRNDIAPPGVWLDNMPAWEFGVLQQARQLALAMPAMSSQALPEVEQASEALLGSSRDWFYPSTEHRLNQAGEALSLYLQRLEEPGAQGLADGGQGLSPWLYSVADSLDSLSYRLSASLGNPEALADLDVDVDRVPGKTPWYKVDNVFFESRGQAWALLSLLKAVRHDQADVLAAHQLTDHWDALIAELQASQRRLWSPVVLNGSGFGMFANHSLVMANHLLGARDRARELADTLGRLTQARAVDGGERVTSPKAVTAREDEAQSAESQEEEAAGPGSEAKIPADAETKAAKGEEPSAPQSAAGETGSDKGSSDKGSSDIESRAESAEPAVIVPASDG